MPNKGTTKYSQGNIINKTIMWKDLRKHMDWDEKTKNSRGHMINEESGCEYGFSLKFFWNIGLKHKGTATSNKCQLFLSTIPFWCGVLTHK